MENKMQTNVSKCSAKTSSTHPYKSAIWLSVVTVGWMSVILRSNLSAVTAIIYFYISFIAPLGTKMENKMQTNVSKCSAKTSSTHPYKSASWLSVITVGWMSGILRLGSKRPLEKKDIFPVRTEDSMEHLVAKLESEWKQEIIGSLTTGCKPRLWKALIRMFTWKEYTVMFVLKLFRFLSTVFLPMLMWFFLSDFEQKMQGGYSASSFLYVTGIVVLAFIKGLSKNHSSAKSEIWGKQLKVSCIGLVYKKVSI